MRVLDELQMPREGELMARIKTTRQARKARDIAMSRKMQKLIRIHEAAIAARIRAEEAYDRAIARYDAWLAEQEATDG